jgi:hypothetical protein
MSGSDAHSFDHHGDALSNTAFLDMYTISGQVTRSPSFPLAIITNEDTTNLELAE